jgi:hypothetical protein
MGYAGKIWCEIIATNETHIVIWHLSIWEEITGVLRDVFISGDSCRILFTDGVNICLPRPDENILRRLRRSQGKPVSICRTNVPTRRYLFNFNDSSIPHNHLSSIRQKSDEEIAALKALHGWSINQGLRKKSSIRYNENQQQLHTWMGGV